MRSTWIWMCLSLYVLQLTQCNAMPSVRSTQRRYQFAHCYYRGIGKKFNVHRQKPHSCEMNMVRLRTAVPNLSFEKAQACVDKMSLCNLYKARGYCNNYVEWMKKNCELTCNLCSVDLTNIVTPPTWTQWSPWGECSKTCGAAKRTRIRSCSSKEPFACLGKAYELRDCYNLPQCGVWGEWGSWGSCSDTCGSNATQFRSRICSKQSVCSGPNTETRQCALSDCPGGNSNGVVSTGGCKDIHNACPLYQQRHYCNNTAYEQWMAVNCKRSCGICGFTEWGAWTECSKSCGGGVKSRTRKCIANQLDCIGVVEDFTPCSVNACPRFGDWGTWGSCDTTCGTGYQKRSRVCENGPGCLGLSIEMQLCPNATDCPKTPAWSEWGFWGSCSETCGSGVELRSRLCKNGPGCPGENSGGSSETRNCTLGNCPVFGEWGSWGTCSVSCGNGTQTRSRPCLNGDNCVGSGIETQPCSGNHCTRLSEWNNWSQCSATCGNGVQRRTRRCLFGPGCTGDTTEDRNCTANPCSIKTNCTDMNIDCWKFVDFCNVGNMMVDYCPKTCRFCDDCTCYTEWTAWSPCSKSCNGGKKTRTRKCDLDSVECGKEESVCNDNICPGTVWGEWSPCSKSCGGGTRERIFKCDRGFSKCARIYEDCQTQPCPSKTCSLGEMRLYGDDSKCCNITLTDECGRNDDAGRIIGGAKADSRRWPWMIYMQMIGVANEAYCGATLIARNWAVTAAHCVRNFQNNADILLTVGFTTIGDNTQNVQQRRVSEIIIHPKFNMPANDIALIKLDKPVTVTKYVRPICLPSGETTAIDKKCFAAGWGTTDAKSIHSSSELKEVALRILDMDICTQAYGASVFGKRINHAMMCAGKISGGVDTCAGDSGGPLMCQRCSSCSWYLAGVTSFGSESCGIANYPGVYTSVIDYEPWIRSIVLTTQTNSFTGC